MKKSLVAGASVAALAMAAVPFAGAFAADVTDTIEVTVASACSFTGGSAGVSYEASGNNGASVQPKNNNSNEHEFTVFCNNSKGYTVSATAHSLTQSGVTDTFAYAATLPSGTTGAWNATISQAAGGSLTIEQLLILPLLVLLLQLVVRRSLRLTQLTSVLKRQLVLTAERLNTL